MSFVVNRWSCRVGTILGGFLVFTGFTSSFFVTENLTVLLLTYSCIAGILKLCTLHHTAIHSLYIHINHKDIHYTDLEVKRRLGQGLNPRPAEPTLQITACWHGLHVDKQKPWFSQITIETRNAANYYTIFGIDLRYS